VRERAFGEALGPLTLDEPRRLDRFPGATHRKGKPVAWVSAGRVESSESVWGLVRYVWMVKRESKPRRWSVESCEHDYKIRKVILTATSC
jgi:hypothetical protein